VSENEVAKTGEEKAKDLLRSGRLVFLQTAGYTEMQILGLGDLAAVPSAKMSELLHRKALAAVLRKRRIRVQTFGGKKRKSR
jgi:hypothetical protein